MAPVETDRLAAGRSIRPPRTRRRASAGLAAAAIAVLALAAPARAERSLAIESFTADIAVGRDGGVDVTETIQTRFTGAWNGLFRTVPVEYQTPQGFNYSLRLAVVAVTDAEGRSLRYEASREGQNLKIKIWVPDARDVVRTVVIRYRVANALRFFETYDELYWNVTGNEWEAPIDAAAATVRLPQGVENVRTAAFTGGYGSREEATRIDRDGADLRVRTLGPLGFRQGLTVAVAWNPGVVHRPTPAERALAFVRSNVMLAVPLLVLPAMWRVWSTRGRDPRRRPVVARYEPPAGLTPGEMGTLVDDKPDLRDVTATLVDLAVRGFVRIEELEDARLFGLLTSKDYRIRMCRRRGEWTALLPHERRVLEGLFKDGSDMPPGGHEADWPSVKLSDLKNRFYKSLPGIRDGMLDRLVQTGVYVTRPDRVRRGYVIGGVILGVGVVWGGVFASGLFGLAPLAAVIAGVLTGGIVCAFGYLMPARTVQGARLLEQALGFEEFLQRVESDRFERVIKTPELFEKYLPYAMALGVEKHWAGAFEGVCTEFPAWYRGSGVAAFHTGSFVGYLGGMTTAAGAAMASAPRSSGGSGFSGGSSGGGFGGGGGGGF